MESTLSAVRNSPGGRDFLIKPNWDEAMTIMNRQTGEVRSRLGGIIALDPTCQMAAIKSPTANGEESLRVVRLRDAEVLLEFPGARSSEVFFATDGSRGSLVLDDRIVSTAIPYDAANLRERVPRLRTALSTSGKAP